MFRGFDITLPNYSKDANIYNKEFYDIGSKMLSENKIAVKDALDNLVLRDGTLDGDKMQEQWFPQAEADVFISHSHKNEETALVLAGKLYKDFKIKSFIDSTVWGYSGELLRQIDTIHCTKDKPNLYDYDLRNLSTSHVYLMLSGALSKMIDNTECVFFLNTPESIQPEKVINSTLSPWIYSEILTTQIINKKPPASHSRRKNLVKLYSEGGQVMINESFAMTRKVELGHLAKINIQKCFYADWLKEARKDSFKLDALYRMYPEEENLNG